MPPDEFESGGTDFRSRKSIEGLKKRIIAFYTQKLTNGWYDYRNAYRAAAEAMGVEVDWGSFTMESRWEAFSRSIYFPKLFLHLAPPARLSHAHVTELAGPGSDR